MADVTFTVTVQNVDGSNHYFIDGVQQDTLFLARGVTYRFDDSDSSVSGHPLAFSITPDGTHNGGTYYNTGTTRSGSPGQPGAYVEIAVAVDAPTQLYYFCQNHSGMGGSMLLADGVNWGDNSWGDNSWNSGVVLQSLTGQSVTTSVGQADGFNEAGWGRQAYDNSGWGVAYSVEVGGVSATTSLGTPTAEEFLDVSLTGFDLTSSLGTPNALPLLEVDVSGFGLSTSLGSIESFNAQGWGRDTWGFENWGESALTVPLTGLGLTSDVGSIEAYNEVGWGHDAWGEESWGQANDAVAELTGVSATTSLGSSLTFDLTSNVFPTGQEATTSVGDPTIIGNVSFGITGVSATTSQGSLDPADVMGVTGQSATSSVGSISPADVMGVTGLSSTTSLGDITVSSNPTIDLTGQAMTSSTGTLSPADVMGITGLSTTSSLGSISPKIDVSPNITGQSITASVATFGTAAGFGIQAFSDVDTGSNSSYTDVATGSNTSYTDAA